MSSSFANQTLAQIELFTKPKAYETGKVYVLPKHLDEKVARLQLSKLGAQLTELSEEQAAYIGVTRRGRTSRIPTGIDAFLLPSGGGPGWGAPRAASTLAPRGEGTVPPCVPTSSSSNAASPPRARRRSG